MLEEGIVGDAALASSDAHAQAFRAIRDAPGEYQRFIPNHAAHDARSVATGEDFPRPSPERLAYNTPTLPLRA
jgi:hypothetical protein